MKHLRSALLLLIPLAAAAAALAGCAPAATAPMDAGPPTYTRDVQPILAAKCSPCHAGQSLGMHNLATTYADAQKDIESLDSYGCWEGPNLDMPMIVGECALVLIMNGRMPMSAGCGAPTPPDPSVCVSSAQQAVIAAWIAAGMPQ